jgi:hypothetical protein
MLRCVAGMQDSGIGCRVADGMWLTGMLRCCLAMRLSHAVCCAAQMWSLKVCCGTRRRHTQQTHGGLIAPCPIVTLIKCTWFLLSFFSRVQLYYVVDGLIDFRSGRLCWALGRILVVSRLRLMLAGRMEQPTGGMLSLDFTCLVL